MNLLSKKIIIAALTIITIYSVNAQSTIQIKSQVDSVSYSLGVLLAQSLKGQGFENLNMQLVAQGLDDELKNAATIDANKANGIVTTFMQKQAQDKHKGNTEAGKKFLAENAKKEGVMTTSSGLQYKVVKQGTGAKPKATDKVQVHYEGTLIDGTIFDSSYKRGESISFPLNGVIAGWTEGLQLMPVGSTYMLYIPAELAYGSRDMGTIKPYSTLIFKVELLDIVK